MLPQKAKCIRESISQIWIKFDSKPLYSLTLNSKIQCTKYFKFCQSKILFFHSSIWFVILEVSRETLLIGKTTVERLKIWKNIIWFQSIKSRVCGWEQSKKCTFFCIFSKSPSKRSFPGKSEEHLALFHNPFFEPTLGRENLLNQSTSSVLVFEGFEKSFETVNFKINCAGIRW